MKRAFSILVLLVIAIEPCLANYEIGSENKTFNYRDNPYGDILICEAAYQDYDLAGLIERIPRILTQLTTKLEFSSNLINPPIKLYHSPKPDSFTSYNGQVFISDGLLHRVDSEDELAFVLAHELAHLYLNHNHVEIQQKSSNYQLQVEQEADKMALEIINRSGFHTISGLLLLERLSGQSRYLNDSNPTLTPRIEELRLTLIELSQTTNSLNL